MKSSYKQRAYAKLQAQIRTQRAVIDTLDRLGADSGFARSLLRVLRDAEIRSRTKKLLDKK